jgi:hypothetical protein
MPGGLDALLEPVDQILGPNLELPHPAWLYMKFQETWRNTNSWS